MCNLSLYSIACIVSSVVLTCPYTLGLSAQELTVRSQADTTFVTQQDTTKPAGRLTVRPRIDATGTETKTAGLEELALFSKYFIYVPQQCVGKTRAPLILLLHGGGRNGAIEAKKFQSLADKHGVIVLAPSSIKLGQWDVIRGFVNHRVQYTQEDGLYKVTSYQEHDIARLDSALKYVLRTYAIDPEKIALVGFSDGGTYSFLLGLNNQDVFSRIAPLSGLIPLTGTALHQRTTQMFISGGLREGNMTKQTLKRAVNLRKEGRPVRTQIGLRGHVDYVEDEDFVWQWLKDSWADPTVTVRDFVARPVDVLLTDRIIESLTTFWTAFRAESNAIQNIGRMQHQVQVPLLIGTEQIVVPMMDIPAMVATFPTLSEILTKSGITAEQVMQYRIALIQAEIARMAGFVLTSETSVDTTSALFKPLDPTSVLGKNLQFLKNNAEKIKVLEGIGMFTTQ